MSLTVTSKVHFTRGEKGKVELNAGPALKLAAEAPVGRVPRISRLMALAIRFEDLLRRGEVKDYAELARLGHVTRARVTQIMNLLNLAPDIQEAILFLPPVDAGHDPVKEWQVRPIAAEPVWARQRRRCHRWVCDTCGGASISWHGFARAWRRWSVASSRTRLETSSAATVRLGQQREESLRSCLFERSSARPPAGTPAHGLKTRATKEPPPKVSRTRHRLTRGISL